MPKIDTQKRIHIPHDLRSKISLEDSAVFYYENNQIFIASPFNEIISNKAILAIRTVDYKGRIFLSNDLLELLDAKIGDTVFVTVFPEENKICIFKKAQ